MKFFSSNKPVKRNKLVWMLNQAPVIFKFDQKGIKNRLMSQIQEDQMSSTAERILVSSKRWFIFKYKWSILTSLVLLLVAGTSTAFVQADIAKPGDALYPLDIWQEQTLLKLPIPAEQKAHLQAKFVGERNLELDYLLNNSGNLKNRERVKKETVNQSQKGLDRAIENVRSAQDHMASSGKTEQAEKMGQILERLESLAGEQEKKVEDLSKDEQDEEIKKEFMNSLIEIRRSKERANR